MDHTSAATVWLSPVGTHAPPPLARRRRAREAPRLYLGATGSRGRAEKRGRRRLRQKPPGAVLLFTDWTLLRLFPPRRAAWSRVGEPALVPVTGQNAQRVRCGALHVHTGSRVVLCRKRAGGATALSAGTHQLAAVGPGTRPHCYETAATGGSTRDRAGGWPQQWPEWHAMDHLWKEWKRLVAANRPAVRIDDLAQQAAAWVLQLRPQEALRKAGILSPAFWLRGG